VEAKREPPHETLHQPHLGPLDVMVVYGLKSGLDMAEAEVSDRRRAKSIE
jgi:hypothetical protein